MTDTILLAFQDPAGNRVEVRARPGVSVMEAAVMNNVDGIEAECGGACICATCHVYCSDAASTVLEAMSSEEDDMLDFTRTPRQPGSRLSCQLRVKDGMQNLLFVIPESDL